MQDITDAIMDRLNQQVAELNWIDIDAGQLDLESPPLDYPCALVDIEEVDYQNVSEQGQIGTALVSVKLAILSITETNVHTPTVYRQQGAAQFNLIKNVFKCLHGFEGSSFGALVRTKLSREKRIYPKIYTLLFSTAIYDSSGAPEYNALTKIPSIKLK